MIRLTLLLCAGLYFSLLVLGEDHGQKRYGLMMAEQQAKAAVTLEPLADPVKEVVFVPAQPVMTAAKYAAQPEPAVIEAATPETAVPETVALDVQTAPVTPPEEASAGGTVYFVAARQVNVRAGPGTDFAVLGSLARDEQVLVVLDADAVAGWSHVRLEGDGIDGYVATKFLAALNGAD